jgi:hypothetical protein
VYEAFYRQSEDGVMPAEWPGSCHAGPCSSRPHGPAVVPQQAALFRLCRAWPSGLWWKTRHGPDWASCRHGPDFFVSGRVHAEPNLSCFRSVH